MRCVCVVFMLAAGARTDRYTTGEELLLKLWPCHSIRIIDRFLSKYGESAAAAAAAGPGCWKYRLLIGPGTISCQDGWTRHQWSEESEYARYCDSSGSRFLFISMIANETCVVMVTIAWLLLAVDKVATGWTTQICGLCINDHKREIF